MTAAATCPHCFAPVRGDGRPTCLCAAAEAEDFDPLRVRPYVSLREQPGAWDDGEEAGGAAGEAGALPGGGRERPDDLGDLPGVDAAVYRVPRPWGPVSEPLVSSTVPLGPAPEGAAIGAAPYGAGTGGAAAGPETGARPGTSAPTGRRRTRSAVLAVTGTAAIAAALAIGTWALPDGGRDRAAPPDRGSTAPTSAAPTAGPTTPAPASDRPAPTTSRAKRSPGASPVPYRPRVPAPRSPVRASGSVAVPSGDASPSAPPSGPIVLREGAGGPEVAELQERLRQMALYTGAADGRYGTAVREAVARYQRTYGVHGDPVGVYGPATRASLEAHTAQP
ncbi:peptidoglycan-binding protein [Streptomyces sp. NPDC093707]|uniref:peptidoglycan-binding protein n=1 Tax=Streptomyces sp. NPDC093707 TaxID=3154984 RepID=UPI003450CE37